MARGRRRRARAATWPTCRTPCRSSRTRSSPQWEGDRVTVWSSTQVPFIARAGVATRCSCPSRTCGSSCRYLGGGFGGKCEFHFEAHVAALARAARPAGASSSSRAARSSSAPDHRREGMVIELETGVTRDGTLVARRGRLVLDNGAYSGRRRVLPAARRDARASALQDAERRRRGLPGLHQHQPSGSVRAPTAPQVCWALEQHMDEVAARSSGSTRSSCAAERSSREGDEGPTRQGFEPIGAARDARARRRDDRLRRGAARRTRRSASPCGWWPSFTHRVGRVREAERRRLGHDHHRRPGVRHRRRDGAAAPRGRGARACEPEEFSLVYQDTDAGPWDMGASGSQTTLQQRPRRDGGRRRGAEQLRELAAERSRRRRRTSSSRDGAVRVKGVAERERRDRGAGATAHGGELLHRHAARGRRREPAPCDAAGCAGRLGIESFVGADVLHPRRALPRRPRDRRRPRARGRRGARLRHDPQPDRRRAARSRAASPWASAMALTEGTLLDDDGRQRNPRCSTTSCRPCADAPADHGRIGSRSPDPRRRPERLEGGRRAAVRRHAGRDRRTRSRRSPAAACTGCR